MAIAWSTIDKAPADMAGVEAGDTVHTAQGTLGDMLDWIDATPRLPGAGNVAEENPAAMDWDLGAGYAGAFELARQGWPEGVKKMKKIAVEAGEHFEQVPALEYDVAGAFPLVPLYCAGSPEHMALPAEAPSRPVCRMAVEVSQAWHIEAEASMRYGVAIVSAVQALIQAGVVVELWGVRSGKITDNYKGKSDWFSWAFPLGGGGQAMDLDRVAFCLAHPALSRRIVFGITERRPELVESSKSNYMRNSGDGVADAGFNVHIPRLHKTSEAETVEIAREKVAKILTEAGYNTAV